MWIYLGGLVIAFLINYKMFRKSQSDVIAMSAFFSLFSWVYIVIVAGMFIGESYSILIKKYNIVDKVKNFLDTILFIKKDN